MRVALITILMTVFFVPVLVLAQEAQKGIVPCTGTDCTACDIVGLASNLMQFFVTLAIVIATLMFTWAGVKYITAGPKPDQISEAHKIFFNVLIGLVVVLAAWLIIDIILRVLPGVDATRTGIAPWAEVLCDE